MKRLLAIVVLDIVVGCFVIVDWLCNTAGIMNSIDDNQTNITLFDNDFPDIMEELHGPDITACAMRWEYYQVRCLWVLGMLLIVLMRCCNIP